MRTFMSAVPFTVVFIPIATTTTISAETERLPLEEWHRQSFVSGYVQLFAGGYQRTGLDNADDENQSIDTLDVKGRNHEQIFPIVYWQLDYNYSRKSRTRLFIGTPDSGVSEFVIPLQMGISRTLADETNLSVAYVPRLSGINEEVWQDPYLTKRNRRKTNVTLQAVRLSAETIFGSPLSVMYDYGEQTISNDRIGESLNFRLTPAQLNKLQRDKKFSRVRLMLIFPLLNNFYFIPQVNYAYVNARGDANRYTATGIEVTAVYQLNRFEFFVHSYVNSTTYREQNPVFNMKRQDSSTGASFGVSYLSICSWKGVTLDFIISSSRQDSNIHFYDKREQLMMLGVGYSF